MQIQTVKINDGGASYLVNGKYVVPVDVGNRHYRQVADWLLVPGNAPEPEFTPAEEEDRAAQALQAQRDATDRALVKANAAVKFLLTKSPDEIDAYISDTINNLAQVKGVIQVLTKVISILVKREYRDA